MFQDIAQCVNPSKNEVEIHLHETDTVAGDHETVSQIRLWVPPGDTVGAAQSEAQKLQENIVGRAKVDKVTGEALCAFPESLGQFLTPYVLAHTRPRMQRLLCARARACVCVCACLCVCVFAYVCLRCVSS